MNLFFNTNKIGSSIRLVVLFSVLLCASYGVFAQKTSVSGVVRSADDNAPLIGASIRVKGGTGGTVTDFDGKFRIESELNATLSFSYTGYESQEIQLAGQSSLEVSLRPSSGVLDEFVVTGYKREYKSDVAASIASVKSEDIEKLVVLGVDQALQGQAAGVQITQTTGAPGDDIAVRIRG